MEGNLVTCTTLQTTAYHSDIKNLSSNMKQKVFNKQ